MKEVELDVSEFDDDKAAILSNCLQNIETLKLRELTLDGTQRICRAINHASKPVC